MKQGLFIVFGGAAALLLAALLPMPYGYYGFMRLAVTVAACIWAWTAYEREGLTGQVVLAGALALLFNPILPVHLSRSIWAPIDVLAATCFAWKAYRVRATVEG
ncbi:MAG: DUF6804 family protein [Allorhizobium sp.]